MDLSCKRIIFRISLALLLFVDMTVQAATMREKKFTAQEIISNWEVYDESGDSRIGFDEISDDGATITFRGTVILKSIYEYYNVKSLTIAYSGAQYTVYPYPPTVGGISFESDADEKSGSPMVSTAPAGTTPMGQIEFAIQSTRNQKVSIEYITIIYDADGAKRNLKWSASAVTAKLGESFDAPTLSGNNLDGVSYSSSNKDVAYIDASGSVSLINTGTTTITAAAPAAGIWDSSSASYNLTVTSSLISETINVSTPGSLKELLVDLDTRPQHLILSGKLNSEDLSYITQAQGKMGSVKSLDMSAVNLDYDNGPYKRISGSDGTGIGLGTLTRQFILSEVCYNDTTSTPNGLGGSNKVIKHYSNNLAGLFYDNTTLEHVKLPASLPGIGGFIFCGSAIVNLSLPDNITEIPEYAFADTKNLAVFNPPASVSRIGKGAFNNSSVKYMDSEQIQFIDDYAFNESDIEQFNFASTRHIGNSAFKNTDGLSGTLSLASAKFIGESCFMGSGFSSVIIKETIDSIPYGAFSSPHISLIQLPENIRYIGESAFFECTDLIINIPEGLSFIGQNAFPTEWLYRQPTDNGVWYFGKVAYKYDPRLSGSESIQLKSGIKTVSPGFASDALRLSLKSLTLPKGIESVGECYNPELVIAEWRKSCFYNCEKLENVNLPEGLRIIGDGAFSGCKKLQIDSWPESLESIGQTAFYGCESLYSLTFGENLTYLGSQAFQECSNISDVKLYSTALFTNGSPFYGGSIEKVTIGSNVTNIPYRMFDSSSNLIKVVFNESADATQPGLSFGDYSFYGCVNLKLESLPARTVSVGNEAFVYVNFGENFSTNNVSEIGNRAFMECGGIKSLTVTSNLKRCGAGAFSDIESLSDIYYNAPNLEIPDDSYYTSPFGRSSNFKATGITSVTIGPDVNVIPANLFRGHPNLSSLTFEPCISQSRSDNSLIIDTRAFYGCNINSLDLPDVRTSIGELSFAGNIGLASLRLGNGTENIGKQAFWQCHALTSVDVPSSVISIGEEAFYQYTSNGFPYQPRMSKAFLHFPDSPEIGYHAFAQSVDVYVPKDMITQYQSSGAGWNTLIPYAIDSFSIDKSNAEIPVGGNMVLMSTVTPVEYSPMDISWISSDPSVAIVDKNGRIEGLKDGSAVITASIAYMDGFSATCNLTVGDNTGIDNVICDGDTEDGVAPAEYFNLQGIRVENPSAGLYIVRQGGKTSKVMVK